METKHMVKVYGTMGVGRNNATHEFEGTFEVTTADLIAGWRASQVIKVANGLRGLIGDEAKLEAKAKTIGVTVGEYTAPMAPVKPKRLEDMTVEELQAELTRRALATKQA